MPQDYPVDSSDSAIKNAENRGLTVIVSDNNTLLIDIDTVEQYAIFQQRIDKVSKDIGMTIVSDEPSRSGLPRRHITIALGEEKTVADRLFLQLYLGSDPIKEYLSFLRYEAGDPKPILFFEKKDGE
jgi:hypothetical protein